MDCTTGRLLKSVDPSPGVDQIASIAGKPADLLSATGKVALSFGGDRSNGRKTWAMVETPKGTHHAGFDPDTPSVWIASQRRAPTTLRETEAFMSVGQRKGASGRVNVDAGAGSSRRRARLSNGTYVTL